MLYINISLNPGLGAYSGFVYLKVSLEFNETLYVINVMFEDIGSAINLPTWCSPSCHNILSQFIDNYLLE